VQRKIEIPDRKRRVAGEGNPAKKFNQGYLPLGTAETSLDIAENLFYLRRFAEVLGAICFSATGETVKLRIAADLGNFIVQAIAAQHAEMPVMIRSAITFRLIFHDTPPLHV
jgi:hypothetical protein